MAINGNVNFRIKVDDICKMFLFAILTSAAWLKLSDV